MAIRKRKSDLPEYGVKIRLYPTLVQQAKLRQFFGNDRFLWNQLVSLYQERYKNNKSLKLLTEFDLNNLLPALKNEYPFLKASDSSSFQIVTKNISDTWEAFFAGTRRKPRFHSKHSAKQSYTGKSSSIRIMGKRTMFLPKLRRVRSSKTGVIDGKIKRYTISVDACGRYWLSLIVEKKTAFLPKTGKAVGIDVGLTHLAILSDGRKFDKFSSDYCEKQAEIWQSKSSKRRHLALVKSQQEANKKVLGAKSLSDYRNWQKANVAKNRYMSRITNQRDDYLHKITDQMVREYDVIVIEDLKIKNMTKNHHLARSILRQSWGRFRDMLEYKCKKYGKILIKVNPAYTSRICSKCGKDTGKKPLSVREWDCPFCKAHHDRDINASINILLKGLAQL